MKRGCMDVWMMYVCMDDVCMDVWMWVGCCVLDAADFRGPVALSVAALTTFYGLIH